MENGQPKVKPKHIRRLLRNKMNFDDFLVKGLVEYLVNITLLFMFRAKLKVNICLWVKILQIVSQKTIPLLPECGNCLRMLSLPKDVVLPENKVRVTMFFFKSWGFWKKKA